VPNGDVVVMVSSFFFNEFFILFLNVEIFWSCI
jgi:hypothetical protein